MDVKFKTMFKNTVTAEVEIVNNVVVRCDVYDKHPFRAIIMKESPYDFNYINSLISMRVFERNNADREFFLNYLGLEEYDPWEIIKRTHGYWIDDCTWILFEGDTACWEDVFYEFRGSLSGEDPHVLYGP